MLPSSIATTDYHTGGEPFRIVAEHRQQATQMDVLEAVDDRSARGVPYGLDDV